MAVNSIFHTSNRTAITSEQNLYRDLVAEAIQAFGHDVHYVDRTITAEDTVFGEDALSKFRNSIFSKNRVPSSEFSIASSMLLS